jgi:lipopolysaccharide transport system permease protein
MRSELAATHQHIEIRPRGRRISLDLRHVWEYRELLYFFAWRDLKVRYKQSIVGAGWAILQPLTMMIVFTIFFGRLAGISAEGIPRPVFYYAALLPWTYFSHSVQFSTNSLVSHSGVLGKVYFPRLLLPLSPVISGLVDFMIAFVILMAMVAYYVVTGHPGIDLGLSALALPLFLLLATTAALASGLWLSTMNARYRDIRYATGFFLQFGLFASPVAYPSSLVPERWRAIYGLNPMAGVIDGFRWAITGQGQPPGTLLGVSIGAVIVLLIGGLWYFRRYEGTIADVV